MAAPLNNALAELLVVVGMDKHSGLDAAEPEVGEVVVGVRGGGGGGVLV